MWQLHQGRGFGGTVSVDGRLSPGSLLCAAVRSECCWSPPLLALVVGQPLSAANLKAGSLVLLSGKETKFLPLKCFESWYLVAFFFYLTLRSLDLMVMVDFL